MTQGVDANRVALLMAMIEKRVGMNVLGEDVFVNVAGGITIDEPAADLGIVVAIASSFRNLPIEAHTAVFGEVGLAGEVRATSLDQLLFQQEICRIICGAHLGWHHDKGSDPGQGRDSHHPGLLYV